MVHKWLLVMVLVVSSFVIVLGAPRAINSEKDLERSVIEFLSQDKEFLRTLEKATELVNDPNSVRSISKRQTDDEDSGQAEGFFKKAAKFIMKYVIAKAVEVIASWIFG